MMTIGQKLRYYRERQDLTQADVAKLIHCERSTYTYYEIDHSKPDLHRFWTICSILQADPGQVLNPDFDPEIDRIRKYQERLRERQKKKKRLGCSDLQPSE